MGLMVMFLVGLMVDGGVVGGLAVALSVGFGMFLWVSGPIGS